MALKRLVKNGIGFALARSGFSSLASSIVRRAGCGILIYHDPSPAVLDLHIKHLKNDYVFISLDELCKRVEAKASFCDAPSLVLTIDDGHAGNYALIDVFHKHNVRPTVYVCSAIVGTNKMFWWQHPSIKKFGVEAAKRLSSKERLRLFAQAGFSVDADVGDRRALTIGQILDLSKVASIQSHTRYHPILTQCTDDEASWELEESKREIEAITGSPCEHLSFPNGNYDERSIMFAKKAGYRSARTCDLGWNDNMNDPYKLKGIPVADDASLNWLDVQMTQLPAFIQYSRKGSFNGRFPQF
jgi:peptidoglycan/xylan/chitin deacetylase (PgdA/CDA1 family)